ncbi:MAG TPA: hypothetical protein PKJ51_03060 [Methanothrix sp.]|nr:hypothetical protein [Methanothrix sp.]
MSRTLSGRAMVPGRSRIAFASGLGESSQTSVAVLTGRDLHNFLKSYPKPDTKFAYYRDLIKYDSALRTGSRSISLLLVRSYAGPKLDLTDKSFEPTDGFLVKIESILAEMEFSRWLGAITRNLIRDGSVFYRVHRTSSGGIERLEYLPPDMVSILSDQYLDDEDKDGVITEADMFLLNETTAIKTREALDAATADDDTDFEVLGPADVLTISWEGEEGVVEDRFGRSTLGLWGTSPLETLAFFSRIKLAAILDSARWVHNAMPRWIATIDLASLVLPDEMPGATKEEKLTAALAEADRIFELFRQQLFYKDEDEDSPTYDQYLPPEPEDLLMLSDGGQIDQKGGSSVSIDITSIIEVSDRAISSVLSVPMTALGYDRGTTYASARVTETFLVGFGGGLIREIEAAVKEFLQAEFGRRSWASTDRDWENLYLDYLVDDTERTQQAALTRKTETETEAVIVNMAVAAFVNQGIMLGEFRSILASLTSIGRFIKVGLPGGADSSFFVSPTAGLPLSGRSIAAGAEHHHGRPSTLDAQLEKAVDDATVQSDLSDLVVETAIHGGTKTAQDKFLNDLAARVEEEDPEFNPDLVEEAEEET